MSSKPSRPSASAPVEPERAEPREAASAPSDHALAALRDLMSTALEAGVPVEEVAAVIRQDAFASAKQGSPDRR
jgi:hypothetical protein